MIPIQMEINGQLVELEVAPDLTLLDLLRDLGVASVKKGCGEGDCGACGVLLDGLYVKSCLVLAAAANGRCVETVESLGDVENPHPLQTAFVDAGAVQCGFCIPSMLLAAKSIIEENPDPTDEEIREGLDGNLCRCTGYVKQIEAVKIAAAVMRSQKEEGHE